MIPLLAPPRSCSSLVAAMLGQHPELYASAELECFTGDTIADCVRFTERVPAVTLHGLVRTLAQLQAGRQCNASVEAAWQWLEARGDWSGAQLVAWLEAQVAPRRLIDKSPIHLLQWRSLERVSRVCAGEPVLHLARHPLTAMISLMNVYQIRGAALSHAEALTAWVRGHSLALRYVRKYSGTPALILRCEDLLMNPEVSLMRVCRHLDISAEPDAIEAMLHPERSPFACLGPSRAMWGNDPHWMRSPVLRRCDQDRSADWNPPLSALWGIDEVDIELRAEAIALAIQLGYQ